VDEDALDLHRFEGLVSRAQTQLAAGQTGQAANLLREALAIWRGEPLADLADGEFAAPEAARLSEVRLSTLEQRVEADLAAGAAADLVPELEALVREHPLRERFRAQLMLALYRSGRQADALDAYRAARQALVDELGIEPSPGLQELERAVLRQDPGLTLDPGAPLTTAQGGISLGRAILVVASDASRLDDLLILAEALARQPPRELIIARLLGSGDELGEATRQLADHRERLAGSGTPTRVAAYTSPDPGQDAAALADEHSVDLVLADAPASFVDSGAIEPPLATILEAATSDVAVLAGTVTERDGPVVTPFGGGEHDWSAIEVAAWLARSLGTSLRLLGTEGDREIGQRDASRLLARASLMVQQVVGIVTEPVLAPAGEEGLLAASTDAKLLVLGLSERWRDEGLGEVRLAAARRAEHPVVLVRHGLRPGGIAPATTMTRFSWTPRLR
jgi:hypothetical protein